LAALKAKLGSPAAICCLGNGPSSEDPTIQNQHFAAVFRVNYQWKTRHFAVNPAVIFTADADLPPQNTDAVLVFPGRPDANRILLHHCRKNRPPRAGYAVFPELLDTGNWPAWPTNGALMIATAAALKPQKIVIAGIDLYRHPAGKYPGDASEINDYDMIHNRETDIAFIRAALKAFTGELVILSDDLKRELS
jgi:hypothetical protein